MHRFRRAFRTALGWAVPVVVLPAVFASCSLDDGIDRAEAVRNVVEESGGALSLEQAECYVDRVLDEVGASALRPGATVPPEQVGTITAIRVDCVGVSNLASNRPALDDTDDTFVAGAGLPKRFGDDPALDALWSSCAEGVGADCDTLFDEAPSGSDYERFAATCGDRTRERRCADVYPSPGVTLPSPAQPTTTVPPSVP
jgi:hypothetical protein